MRSLGIRTSYFSHARERFTIKLLDHQQIGGFFHVENLPENYIANSFSIRYLWRNLGNR